jgi:uncharacterized protein YegJ (DUF2314 family)
MRAKPLIGLLVVGVLAVALFSCGIRSFFKPHEIIRISASDPQLQAAARQAQSKLPDFISNLKNNDGSRFAIKGRFETSVGSEYLWLKDLVLLPNGSITGTIDQQPIALRAKKGDRITVRQEDIYDWMIEKDGNVEGGFTERALKSR